MEVLEKRLREDLEDGKEVPAALHKEIREVIDRVGLYEGLIGVGTPEPMNLPSFEEDFDEPHPMEEKIG